MKTGDMLKFGPDDAVQLVISENEHVIDLGYVVSSERVNNQDAVILKTSTLCELRISGLAFSGSWQV